MLRTEYDDRFSKNKFRVGCWMESTTSYFNCLLIRRKHKVIIESFFVQDVKKVSVKKQIQKTVFHFRKSSPESKVTVWWNLVRDWTWYNRGILTTPGFFLLFSAEIELARSHLSTRCLTNPTIGALRTKTITDIFLKFQFLSNFHANLTLCAQWRTALGLFPRSRAAVDAKAYSACAGFCHTHLKPSAKTTSKKFPSEFEDQEQKPSILEPPRPILLDSTTLI
jgi:hypothetical protein